MIRLDKYLADMGAGTRQEVKRKIRKGLVSVNHKTAGAPDLKIREGEDVVSVEGREIGYAAYEYYMLNKPAGVVSATTDSRDLTVVDLIQEKRRKDLFPVGRLDKDTEGLLLLTDDGELAHRLTSPAGHVPKTYYVEVDGVLTQEQQKALEEGVDIGEERPTRPARVTAADGREAFHSPDAASAWNLTITEGRFHQVKRMMQAVGMRVVYLKRVGMGTLTLDPHLASGQIRELTQEETDRLRKL